MKSEMTKQLIRVLEKLKNYLALTGIPLTEISPNASEYKDIINKIFDEVAEEFSVTASTIRDKCCRQMDYSFEEFLVKAIEQLTGINNDLLSNLIAHIKPSKDNASNIITVIRNL